jgi:hypothetical protein
MNQRQMHDSDSTFHQFLESSIRARSATVCILLDLLAALTCSGLLNAVVACIRLWRCMQGSVMHYQAGCKAACHFILLALSLISHRPGGIGAAASPEAGFAKGNLGKGCRPGLGWAAAEEAHPCAAGCGCCEGLRCRPHYPGRHGVRLILPSEGILPQGGQRAVPMVICLGGPAIKRSATSVFGFGP